MKYEEFILKFKLQSSETSLHRQLSLAISVCKKLFFDYQKFFDDNDWGDPDILLDAIKVAETYSVSDNSKVKALLPKIIEVCPDSEDFEDASYAINSCGAVLETLEFLIDGKSDHIYNIGTYLTDTIDAKIQEDADLTENQTDNHPLMIEARNYLIDGTK